MFIIDSNGARHYLTLLISPSPLEVDIKPHGNSTKGAEPYFRTSESAIRALKSELKFTPPKEAVEKVCKDKGGEISAESAGSLPRNRQQAYTAKKREATRSSLQFDFRKVRINLSVK